MGPMGRAVATFGPLLFDLDLMGIYRFVYPWTRVEL
jgi:hypothetical protein